MLIRVLVSSFLFVFLVALAGCGPKNFDDCVLKNMKGVKDKFAAMAVTTTCRNKFPFPVEEKKIHIEVPSEVIDKIRGEIELYSDRKYLKGEFYNPTTEWTITSVTIGIINKKIASSKEAEEGEFRKYQIALLLNPQTVETFVGVSVLAVTTEWSWDIFSAKGYQG